jgi:hypothetical protein
MAFNTLGSEKPEVIKKKLPFCLSFSRLLRCFKNGKIPLKLKIKQNLAGHKKHTKIQLLFEKWQERNSFMIFKDSLFF